MAIDEGRGDDARARGSGAGGRHRLDAPLPPGRPCSGDRAGVRVKLNSG